MRVELRSMEKLVRLLTRLGNGALQKDDGVDC